MSVTQNITAEHKWFIGEDKILEFEVLDDDGKAIDDPTKLPYDVAGKTLVYSLKKKVTDADPGLIEKRTGGLGITIVGIYSASRASNTQRTRVAILDSDTDAFKKTATYQHSLSELTNDAETVLVDGTAVIQRSTKPPV
jgi:hypothetical protein